MFPISFIECSYNLSGFIFVSSPCGVDREQRDISIIGTNPTIEKSSYFTDEAKTQSKPEFEPDPEGYTKIKS